MKVFGGVCNRDSFMSSDACESPWQPEDQCLPRGAAETDPWCEHKAWLASSSRRAEWLYIRELSKGL